MRHGIRWYWHRLRVMEAAEVRGRILQRCRQWRDRRRLPDFSQDPVGTPTPGAWPVLPPVDSAPEELRQALRRDVAEILGGRWRAFGHLALPLDDPPRWACDYAAGREVRTLRHASSLNHRELPAGADIKLVWELSRWPLLVRLAQAGWLLDDPACSNKARAWIEDWIRENPPLRGWNWTSALESGIRLINFAWVDALLAARGAGDSWQAARQAILAPHVWFTWRHRSFGTSANNHLLGELAGLIVAVTRWPNLERWAASAGALQSLWEREVLAQFAEDGGNREQALNYQLFSWELCWHARNALAAAGISVSDAVDLRLRRASDFLVSVQVPRDAWDYGDSDNALVSPLYADETRAAAEWFQWFSEPHTSPALRWWLGDPPPPCDPPACEQAGGDWLVFRESGQAVQWSGDWSARWDLSPLGYLRMASHGHLDALHLSLWLRGVALVIDPGTGAYYGDTRLRAWLASWAAHNGPRLDGVEFPRRLGPFLWEEHHPVPAWQPLPDGGLAAELRLPQGIVCRQVRRLLDAERDGWQVDDLALNVSPPARPGFRVCWQFAPGTRLDALPGNPRFYLGERQGVRFTVGLDAAWTEATLIPETRTSVPFPVRGDLEGLCSQAFRRIESGPVLRLAARGENPAMYRTTFLLRKD